MGEIIVVLFLGTWLSGASYFAYKKLKREMDDTGKGTGNK